MFLIMKNNNYLCFPFGPKLRFNNVFACLGQQTPNPWLTVSHYGCMNALEDGEPFQIPSVRWGILSCKQDLSRFIEVDLMICQSWVWVI
jgi:hypothetical protein